MPSLLFPVGDSHIWMSTMASCVYGRNYLPFSSFTYGASGCDRHTHAGEAAVLLLDCQAHIVYLFTQFSHKLAMCETLHDCKHGELEW